MLGPVTQAYADLAGALAQRGPPEVRLSPEPGATYAEIIAATATARVPGDGPITVERLAWVLLGIGMRETGLGTAKDCDQAGPGCTGDFGARVAHAKHRTGRHIICPTVADLPAAPPHLDGKPRRWAPPRDDHGVIIPGPYAVPIDGRGFGRDPWQADYDAHPEVTDARLGDGRLAWTDVRWACDAAAVRFLADLSQTGMIRPAIAAYNCGVGGVRRALSAGLNIDANTTGGDYSRWVLGRIAEWTGVPA